MTAAFFFHLLLIAFEFRGKRFFKSHCLGSDNVFQGPSLDSRKYGRIEQG
jgi:hypothetical protein